MMKNNLTELVFIIDCSGSMHGLEKDTIGGFNAMIARQKQQEGEVYVSTILFNSICRVLHDRVKLADVRDMTEKEYAALQRRENQGILPVFYNEYGEIGIMRN